MAQSWLRCCGRGEVLYRALKMGFCSRTWGPEVLWLSVPGLGLLLGEENPVLPGQHHAGLVFWARGDQGSPSASPGHGRASPEQGTRGLGGSEPR